MRSTPFVCALSLLSVSALFAENSGAYGEVGFQYSNMTKATKSTQTQDTNSQQNVFDPANAKPVPLPGQTQPNGNPQ
ncbi:hypothetical protein NHP190003_12480 [Helicobacter sp. NHP19-003]|uniref:Part of outer membrane protein HorA n=1 Tax=Helicobacter gastrocanis TaxID=2849641 RepID=A0ABM7SBE9_9HELI|nr:hypothetical protein [Helicobacter sp. NHP19-003]BCZ17966.1 hypothetical protein NHP190003_12480 [Helicobacter sp. NHP19-003]